MNDIGFKTHVFIYVICCEYNKDMEVFDTETPCRKFIIKKIYKYARLKEIIKV